MENFPDRIYVENQNAHFVFNIFFRIIVPWRGGTWYQKWEHLKAGESNGKLPVRTCSGCGVPQPYRSPDWALVPAQTGPRAEH